MHQVFIEGGLIRKLWSVETTRLSRPSAPARSLKVVVIVSVARSPTIRSEAMPQRRAAAM